MPARSRTELRRRHRSDRQVLAVGLDHDPTCFLKTACCSEPCGGIDSWAPIHTEVPRLCPGRPQEFRSNKTTRNCSRAEFNLGLGWRSHECRLERLGTRAHGRVRGSSGPAFASSQRRRGDVVVDVRGICAGWCRPESFLVEAVHVRRSLRARQSLQGACRS